MKRLIFLAFSTTIATILFLSISLTTANKQLGEDPSYKANWAKVDSLEKKGLFRMALAEVDLIFDDATKNLHHNQVIKAVLYELKYNTYLEEDDYVLGIYRLDELVAKAPSPSKEILHSLIAEVYWGYYSSNAWKFSERTNVFEVDLQDVRTWDLRKIAEKVRYHYMMSLTNSDLSKSKLIKDFSEIASYTSESSEIRPTLFDFLGHRALDFFKSTTFGVPGPAETYVIEGNEYFASNSTFLQINPITEDSLNTQFYAVRLLQELTKFHQEKNNLPALFSIELERLKFINSKSVDAEKSDRYYEALTRMTLAYEKIPYVSEAWYEIALVHSSLGDTYNYFADTTYRWDKKIALDICDKTISQYKDAYGSQQCAALKSTILQKNITLSGEEATIPNTNSKISVQYRNVNKIYLKVAAYDYKKFYSNNRNYEKFVKELRAIKGVYQKEIDLTNPYDYQNHMTEVLLPNLAKGFYFVIVSTDPNFEDNKSAFAFTPLWSTNVTYQTRNLDSKHQVLASNRTTGEPLVGAKVNVAYEEYNYKLRYYENKTLGNYTTDANGLCSFDSGDDYRTFQITVSHNGDTYSPNQGLYSYYYYDRQDDSFDQTHFFTDRKIYRPGQTIYFKGISVNGKGKERKLITDQTTTVYLYDVNGQEVAKKEVTTNQFGSFEGSFVAPFGVLTGQMTLSNSYGSTYFRVEEYKRPKFSVEMKPIEGEIQVNEKVTATGNAKAYAGNNIDGAAVKYRITRTTGFNWSNYYYWHWRPYYQPKEVEHGDLVTDDEGNFKIEFLAAPDKSLNPKDLPIFTYTIYADVTDINGETHSTSTSFIVGYQSLQLGHNINSDMNNEEDYFLRLRTTNLNGQKIPAVGNIKISKLITPKRSYYTRLWAQPDMQKWSEKEFNELFPNEEYKDENKIQLWKTDKKVFETNFNTKTTDSIAISNYKNWEPGVYLYEAVAKDKNGLEVKDNFYFTVYNPNSKVAPNNDVLWIKATQSIAEPGETIDILLSTKEKNLSVLYDLEVNNNIAESKRITLSDEQIKLSIPVKEEYRGNFTIHFTCIKNNRTFNTSITINVPYTNKQLDLEFSTFRDKLLPGQNEEWTMTIKNKKGEKEVAELLATLYDASLDELYTPNSFYFNVYQNYYGNGYWGNAVGSNMTYAYNINYYWNDYVSNPYRYFPTLNYYGFSSYYYNRYYYDYDNYLSDDASINQVQKSSRADEKKESSKDDLRSKNGESVPSPVSAVGGATTESEERSELGYLKAADEKSGPTLLEAADARTTSDGQVDLSNVSARSNFNETAFFYPQLTTNDKGDIQIKFTIPESLTKWRFLGMAHTKDLKFGNIQEDVVTQKDLMVVPNAPRFFREGDKITLSAKISNISKDSLSGAVQLDLIDPFTEEKINEKFKNKTVQLPFGVAAGKSTVVSWNIEIPYNLSAAKYKIVAAAGKFSDGEESVVPILSNRMLVTESMPMPVRGNQTKTFNFEKLKNSGKSKTLVHHRYTVEFTSNPAWYAIQAMPYMMEYPYECAEQTFTRYYSNAIASHIMNSNPKIKKVIEDWGQNSPDAFLSNLQKNQELKEVMLQETPWVLDAKNEEQSKKNLAVLLDMERMSRELDKALTKTIKAQSSNGGWPWFPGMPESRYITQHIITGMGHLDHLGIKDVKENHKVWSMVKKGIDYLDGEIVRDYRSAKKYDPNYLINQHIGYNQVQYLYARSYFPQLSMNKETTEAVSYYKDQAVKFWLTFNIYAEGMLALAAHRFEMKELATDIVKSLKDRAINHDEFGMYWKDYQAGYYWYEAPIETQAIMIEMFDEVTDDQAAVEELKIWLLKQKQTTNWKTTKQTTEAVYALLLKGTDLLAEDGLVEINVGGQPIVYTDKPDVSNPYQVKAQAGTGYIKTAWTEDQVKAQMGEITIKKATKGIAWGAAYWQYFEDLDKITFAETPLSLKKHLFIVELTNEGEKIKPVSDKNVLHIGDKIRVRIELRTDRNLEYVHMKDMRASGFEPINVLSTYKYRDGLGYYEATKDAATNFFFDYIPKGTYVFEYDLRVEHKGDFSNGITTIQCMYAPEFTSHSEGIRVIVE